MNEISLCTLSNFGWMWKVNCWWLLIWIWIICPFIRFSEANCDCRCHMQLVFWITIKWSYNIYQIMLISHALFRRIWGSQLRNNLSSVVLLSALTNEWTVCQWKDYYLKPAKDMIGKKTANYKIMKKFRQWKESNYENWKQRSPWTETNIKNVHG